MNPIGVFDSGYGGLTVLGEIVRALPEYDYYYLGDNARAPYGSRDYTTVYAYTLQAVEWLFQQGCNLVILACNTASAKALRTIQQQNLPLLDPEKRVLGVIRPTAEVIGNFSDTKHVGIFGTPGTVQSESYCIEINKFFPDIKVSQEACPLWAPLVETGMETTPGADYFIRHHVNRLLEQDEKIDTVLLACTHYPLLQYQITRALPPHIKVVSQGEIVAHSLGDYLKKHPEIAGKCSTGGQIKYFTTGDPEEFNKQATRFLGREVAAEKVHLR